MKTKFMRSSLLFLILFFSTTAYSAVDIAMEISPSPVKPKDLIHISITVTNTDIANLVGPVTIELQYPEHLNGLYIPYAGMITTGGSANTVTCNGDDRGCKPGQLVIWDLGDIPPGDGVTVTMAPAVSYSAADGTLIPFRAVLRVSDIQQGEVSKTAVVKVDPFFELAVDEEGDPVASGDTQEYTITYSHISTGSSNTNLTFPLPAGSSFVSATDGGIANPANVYWDLGTLASGDSGQRRVTIRTNSNTAEPVIIDRVQLRGMDSGFAMHEAFAQRITRVKNSSSVKVEISLNKNPVQPRKMLGVKLTVTNPLDSILSDVKLLLHYPEHLNGLYIPYAGMITTGSSANTVTCNGDDRGCGSGQLVVWELGNIPARSGVTVTMAPTVLSAADGTLIQFEAELRVGGIQQVQVSKTTVVQSSPSFELTVDEEIDPMTSDGTREYTITYSNISTSSSHTMLTFPLPTGSSFVATTGGGVLSSDHVNWNLGGLAGGEGGEQRVTVKINSQEGEILLLDPVRLRGMDASFVFHETLCQRITRIQNGDRPDVEINFAHLPYKASDTLPVELTVTNSGNNQLANVELLLHYPEHLNGLNTNGSAITTGAPSNTVECPGNSCKTGFFVTWGLGNIPPMSDITVTMSPNIYFGTINGSLVQFEAELRVNGIQQVQVSDTAFVGSIFTKGKYSREPGKPGQKIFFPVRANNGKTVILSL